ncbi:MAG: hypothetical protein WCJ53_12535 [Mycobacteriaceae bacterium]
MTEIHTQHNVLMLGDVDTSQRMDMLAETAAQHGAVITHTFAFARGEAAGHDDLTQVDEVIDAMSMAIASQVPLWIPFWRDDLGREQHLRRIGLALERHGVELLVGPQLAPCPSGGGLNELDVAVRNEVRAVYALADAATVSIAAPSVVAEIEAALAYACQQPEECPPVEEVAPEERIYRTGDVAFLMRKSRRWVKRGLRDGLFENFDGSPIEPLRTGKGKLRFTRGMLWAMTWSARQNDAVDSRCVKEVLAELDRRKR